MKNYLILASSAIFLAARPDKPVLFINPTGTYKLVAKTIKKGDDIYGYHGDIQVKSLASDKIVMTFFVSEGARRYNSGSFIDTLPYKDNTAVYTFEEYDPSCKITFRFSEKGTLAKQQT